MRLQMHKNYTKVDFGYVTSDRYYRGGWIRISNESFIEIKDTKERFYLKTAEGITMAPEKHNFESKRDWRYYSLYFDPIPQIDTIINIIEKENGDLNDFNYFDIQLDLDDALEIL